MTFLHSQALVLGFGRASDCLKQMGIRNKGSIDFDSLLQHRSSGEWIQEVLCMGMGTREESKVIRGEVSLGEAPSGLPPCPGPQPREETVTTVPERMLSESPLLCWTSIQCPLLQLEPLSLYPLSLIKKNSHFYTTYPAPGPRRRAALVLKVQWVLLLCLNYEEETEAETDAVTYSRSPSG